MRGLSSGASREGIKSDQETHNNALPKVGGTGDQRRTPRQPAIQSDRAGRFPGCRHRRLRHDGEHLRFWRTHRAGISLCPARDLLGRPHLVLPRILRGGTSFGGCARDRLWLRCALQGAQAGGPKRPRFSLVVCCVDRTQACEVADEMTRRRPASGADRRLFVRLDRYSPASSASSIASAYSSP